MNYTHGMANTMIYGAWRTMRTRCENPKSQYFANYGGRGITVCDRWKRFEDFYADMGDPPPGMTIERKDNDKGYSPDNCVWADRRAQNRNKRSNRLFSYKGETKTVTEWANIFGLPRQTVSNRVNRGWTIAQALETPNANYIRKGVPRGVSVVSHLEGRL